MRRDRSLPLPKPGLPSRRWAWLSGGLLVLAALCFPWSAPPAQAQETSVVQPGSTAVTGFSGTVVPGMEVGLAPGADQVDETFIDTEGATLRIFDLSRLGGPAAGQFVATPPPFEATAGQIGQVFGLTYDDGVRDGEASGVPSLYAGATALYGIRIVTPDADGDGRPERLRRGAPGAVFMDGQFGAENGGGPGTIWKIDGLSGAVMKFANIDTNSGPGIGDVSFDPDHRQFFASDLDSGLVHRIDAAGAPVDTFDHGVDGRPRRGMEPVADDGSVMDIRGTAFDSQDPRTWGFTQDARRVWALAYHEGRLYYTVGKKAEVWSVGIADDGRFAGDARWELTAQGAEAGAVTDIVFDGGGRLYLAQRGLMESRYDYRSFADSGKAAVLRFARETPDDPATESVWASVPDEYAVGFADGYRQSAGGLDLQYGYDADGDIDLGACAATLVDTGDRLRDNPALAGELAAGGPATVDGVQLTPLPLVRPRNEPPFGSWFVDFDGYFEDSAAQGHVGDVEVWRPCEGPSDDRALEEVLPFHPPNPAFEIELPLCSQGRHDSTCRYREPNLEIEKRAAVKRCSPAGGCDLILRKRARSPVCSAGGTCTFVIDIVNNGTGTYNGPLTVRESYPLGAPASSTFGPTPPWICGPDGPGRFRCDNAAVVLTPGASTSITVRTALPAGYEKDRVRNCAAVEPVPGETDLANNKACADARVRRKNPGQPALRITKTCAQSAPGAAVSCRIAVASLGAAAPSGPVRVHDVAKLVGSGTPVQIQAVTPDGPEWACDALPATALSCTIPGHVMAPGVTRRFDVTVSGNGRFENCAHGTYGPAPGGDIVTPFGRACAMGGAATPIRVEKTGDTECRIGVPCAFHITVTNDSDAPFSAPMRFGDAIGIDGIGRLEGVAIRALSPSFGCAEASGTLPLSCIATLALGAHESRSYAMTVVLPDSPALAKLDGKASGRNCIGVVPPGTPVRGGAGGGGDAAGGGKAYACHRFTVVKEAPKACSKGFVMNDKGGCVCPEGTTFRNGRCSPRQPREPEKPQQCVLLEGQVRTAAGECVCPRDMVLVNGACIPAFRPEPPAPVACTLLPGQVRTRAGDCVCPRGTELRGGRCRQERTVETCQVRGQVHTRSGKCVCPRGTKAVRGACRKPRVAHCPEGTVRRGGRCVEVRRDCPEGMIGEYPDCFRRRRPQIQINPGDLLDLIPRHRPHGERVPDRKPNRQMRQQRPQPLNRVFPGVDLF